MIGNILIAIVVVLSIYAVVSDFGVRGWREDGKLWWRK